MHARDKSWWKASMAITAKEHFTTACVICTWQTNITASEWVMLSYP